MENLNLHTRFDLNYLFTAHYLALGHLYSFAGKMRTVNISKDGFLFPLARYLDQSMSDLEKNILKKLPDRYFSLSDLISDIAVVHAELLFIHPFREGNGRTARLIANLMAYKAGFKRLNFEKLASEKNFGFYVQAVQQAGLKEYSYMEKIIQHIFSR